MRLTRAQMVEALGLEDEALFMDGFDSCVLGSCIRFGVPVVVAYDLDKVLAELCRQGMGYEEAAEFCSYNQMGAYVGEFTPVFVRRLR